MSQLISNLSSRTEYLKKTPKQDFAYISLSRHIKAISAVERALVEDDLAASTSWT